jgi:hypothetical protein
MKLEDKPAPGDKEGRRIIGALTACWVCPARKRNDVFGGRVAAVRQIVNIEPVTSQRRPATLDPIHWYWEGRGE